MSPEFGGPTRDVAFVSVEPMDTSYDAICAADRDAPEKACFGLLARPGVEVP